MTESVLDRVKKAFTNAGLDAKQTNIAKVAKVAQASVSLWRSNQISLDAARLIAKATRTCVEWIMTGEGPMRPAAGLPDDLQALVDGWPLLDDEHRASILGYAKGVVAYARSTSSTASPERLQAVHDRIEAYQSKNHKSAPERPSSRHKASPSRGGRKPRR